MGKARTTWALPSRRHARDPAHRLATLDPHSPAEPIGSAPPEPGHVSNRPVQTQSTGTVERNRCSSSSPPGWRSRSPATSPNPPSLRPCPPRHQGRSDRPRPMRRHTAAALRRLADRLEPARGSPPRREPPRCRCVDASTRNEVQRKVRVGRPARYGEEFERDAVALVRPGGRSTRCRVSWPVSWGRCATG